MWLPVRTTSCHLRRCFSNNTCPLVAHLFCRSPSSSSRLRARIKRRPFISPHSVWPSVQVVVEPHRFPGVFVIRGKEDALATLNGTPGKKVYDEKLVKADVSCKRERGSGGAGEGSFFPERNVGIRTDDDGQATWMGRGIFGFWRMRALVDGGWHGRRCAAADRRFVASHTFGRYLDDAAGMGGRRFGTSAGCATLLVTSSNGALWGIRPFAYSLIYGVARRRMLRLAF